LSIQSEAPAFDGYKLRRIFCRWYLLLVNGDDDTGLSYGPFAFDDAVAFAKEQGLRDHERELGERGR